MEEVGVRSDAGGRRSSSARSRLPTRILIANSYALLRQMLAAPKNIPGVNPIKTDFASRSLPLRSAAAPRREQTFFQSLLYFAPSPLAVLPSAPPPDKSSSLYNIIDGKKGRKKREKGGRLFFSLFTTPFFISRASERKEEKEKSSGWAGLVIK